MAFLLHSSATMIYCHFGPQCHSSFTDILFQSVWECLFITRENVYSEQGLQFKNYLKGRWVLPFFWRGICSRPKKTHSRPLAAQEYSSLECDDVALSRERIGPFTAYLLLYCQRTREWCKLNTAQQRSKSTSTSEHVHHARYRNKLGKN